MRKLLIALAFTLPLFAQSDLPEPLAITLEPLGDSPDGIVTRVAFRFATPPEVPPETGLFLQGSFLQDGVVIRNFRVPVPPQQRDAMRMLQTFKEGTAEIEARVIMPNEDEAGPPALLMKTAKTFAIAKTNHIYVAEAGDGVEAIVLEGVVPEITGAVKIRSPRRDVAPNLFIVDVEADPRVKRVEFWVEGKKVLARNAPPFTAELDLGKLPKRVEVRAIGYDAAGRYVDADAFMVSDRDMPMEAKLTRTETPDGVSHIKLSVQNPKNSEIRSVVLYGASNNKLYEWKRPPYAVDMATARLASEKFIRASVIDATGYEASDLMFLNGDRLSEEIEVNLVELPVTVTNASGSAITDLTEKEVKVLENGKPQKISSFNFATNLPLSIGVLLDHSGSMEERMEDAKSAAIAFFRSIIKPRDRAFIGAFAGDPSRNAPFVSDLGILEAQVNAIPKAAGGTALFDAIVTGLYRFRSVPGRKALIVISDGDDTTSRLPYEDVLTYARASRVPIYFIGIGFGFGEFGGPARMKSLAAETGGSTWFIKSAKQLGEVYAQLEKELRSQYLITYETESSKKDQTYRTIEVKVERPDARVRTIRGFIP
ncbi:MAG TPA: VWA domain-containing protein [Thermoanaerobaculia bacterium]|jgi:VWFA-related protein